MCLLEKPIILITSLVVCVMDADLHSIAVDSGQLSQFSCKGFLSLAGFFNNHLSHRYGCHSTYIFLLLLRVTRLHRFHILTSLISLVCSSLTVTEGNECRCSIISRYVSYDVAAEVFFLPWGQQQVVMPSWSFPLPVYSLATVLCKLHPRMVLSKTKMQIVPWYELKKLHKRTRTIQICSCRGMLLK